MEFCTIPVTVGRTCPHSERARIELCRTYKGFAHGLPLEFALFFDVDVLKVAASTCTKKRALGLNSMLRRLQYLK